MQSGRTWFQHCNFISRTGVGTLFLVDFDVVEPSNLNRQSYYISHLGLPKTEALKQQIEQINPFIKVKTKQIRVTEENAHSLLRSIQLFAKHLITRFPKQF
ncbi:MAG: ThiF family adenylyltransferase [Acutalibacteraceae bacterium]